MTHRSHTETFILLRNNATKKRYFYKEFETDDERVNLVNGKNDANDIELTIDGDNLTDTAIPDWVSNVDEFRYEVIKINTKLDQLNVIQREHLKSKSTSIFSDDSESAANQSYEIEIEFKCQEINKLFNRLHTLMNQMQGLAKMRSDSRIIKNVFQWQCKEIQELTHKYRFCQNNYIIKCTESDKIDEQFVITFDAISDKSANKSQFGVQLNGDEVSFFEDLRPSTGPQQQQMMTDVLVDTEHLIARDQEMNAIVKSIGELNQVFQDINTLVITQGSVLDRIDYNVETVQHRVEDGVLALSKAEKSMRSARKMKLILILSGFVILLFMYLIIFKT
ncbi:syntaxin-16-like [Oppia nitens]|uniref:syntaxin-16-like n=1 Tax=Oppia nitens TaxID=1686743 RepID=UPI0023D9F218|nr:syntaxin-16-like [Oppia nitens]